MPKKHQWLPFSLLLLTSFIFGIVVDITVKNWPILELKNDVDVFSAATSILTIAVTVGVAWWVTNVLEKENSDNSTEKEIIRRHVDLLYEIVEDTRSKVRGGKINYSLAATNNKRIYTNSEDIINKAKRSLTFTENHLNLIHLKNQEVKNLLTGTLPNDTEISVVNNEIRISESRQAVIDSALDKLRSEILNLELAINRG